MLQLGILGLGEGRSTVAAAMGSKRYHLAMICDSEKALCSQGARESGFPVYTTRYRDMLEDPLIDVIAIHAPDCRHTDVVKKALAHGKHVVCTGAFTEDLSMAGELLQLQQQTGRNVFAGLGSRFLEPARRQRADFQAGMIGELVTIESHYHADHRSLPGMPWAAGKSLKWLYGGLSHSVDIVRWYLPNIEEVMGYGMISSTGRKAGLKDEDTMHFIFRAADGRIARVSGSYCSSVQPTQRDSAMTCILRCTGGTSQADCHDLRYTVADRTGKKKVTRWDAAARKPYSRSGSGSREVGAFRHCLDYFADSIEEGFTAYPDMREGIGTIALLQAMDRSLQTKQPVMVQSILEESGVDRLLQASKTLQWCDLDC